MALSPTLSPNLGLILTPKSEGSKRFIDFRTELAGDNESSNMMILDKAFADMSKDQSDHINSLSAHSDIFSSIIVISDKAPKRNCTLWFNTSGFSEGDGLCSLYYKDEDGNLHPLFTTTKKECLVGMEDVDNHIASKNNPHGIDCATIGASKEGHTHEDLSQAITGVSDDIKNIISVPESAESDDGKFLRVVDGVAVWQAIEIAEDISV